MNMSEHDDETDLTEVEAQVEAKKEAETDRADRQILEEIAGDLVALEKELRAHGFSISMLLRGYAKHFHGISLPILKTAKKED